MASETRSVVVERDIPFPPEKLWRALTQPHLIEAWLMSNDFAPVVGHHFNLRGDWGGVLDCEVLAVEPNRTLSYRWDFAHEDPAYDLRSVVTFTLTPTTMGTHLRVEQSGFRPDQKQAFGGAIQGWQGFLAKLEQLLAGKATIAMETSKRDAKDVDGGASASSLIDAKIATLRDWRGETLARARAIIRSADPEVVETVKWGGVPVWEHGGILCTGETYKAAVKLTFARGAALDDPSGLFNASLEGATRRAIDFHEGDRIDEEALAGLIRAAVALNVTMRAASASRARRKPGRD